MTILGPSIQEAFPSLQVLIRVWILDLWCAKSTAAAAATATEPHTRSFFRPYGEASKTKLRTTDFWIRAVIKGLPPTCDRSGLSGRAGLTMRD